MIPHVDDDPSIEERRVAPERPVRGGRRWIDDPEEVRAHDFMMDDAGARIHFLRTERNWSVDRLAVASGVSPQSISNVENGRTDPNVSTLTRLFRAMGYHVRVIPEPIAPHSNRANQPKSTGN